MESDARDLGAPRSSRRRRAQAAVVSLSAVGAAALLLASRLEHSPASLTEIPLPPASLDQRRSDGPSRQPALFPTAGAASVEAERHVGIHGRVVLGRTGVPVSDALVRVGTVTTASAEDGAFAISIPPCVEATIEVSAAGCRQLETRVGPVLRGTIDAGTLALSGVGTLLVRVEDPLGLAVPRAAVRVAIAAGPRWRGSSPATPTSTGSAALKADPAEFVATTDHAGLATISDVPGDRPYHLVVTTLDGQAAVAGPIGVTDETPVEVVVRIPAGCARLRITLGRADYAGVAGWVRIAPLGALDPAPAVLLPLVDGQAEVLLPRGDYRVDGEAGPRRLSPVHVRMDGDQELSFELHSFRVVHVRAHGPDGRPVRAFRCRAVSVAAGDPSAEETPPFALWGMMLRSHVEAQDGVATWRDWESNAASSVSQGLMLVLADGYRPCCVPFAFVPNGPTHVRASLEPAATLRGRLLGRVLPRAVRLVMLRGDDAGGIGWQHRRSSPLTALAPVDAQGGYEFQSWGAGEYELCAADGTRRFRIARLDLPSTGEVSRHDSLDVSLVRVSAQDGGSPPPTTLQALDGFDEGPDDHRITGMRIDQVVVFHAVPAGRYLLGWPADLDEVQANLALGTEQLSRIGRSGAPRGSRIQLIDVSGDDEIRVVWGGPPRAESRLVRIATPPGLDPRSLVVAAIPNDGARRSWRAVGWQSVDSGGRAWVPRAEPEATLVLATAPRGAGAESLDTGGSLVPVAVTRLPARSHDSEIHVQIQTPARIALDLGAGSWAVVRWSAVWELLEWESSVVSASDTRLLDPVLPGPVRVRRFEPATQSWFETEVVLRSAVETRIDPDGRWWRWQPDREGRLAPGTRSPGGG